MTPCYSEEPHEISNEPREIWSWIPWFTNLNSTVYKSENYRRGILLDTPPCEEGCLRKLAQTPLKQVWNLVQTPRGEGGQNGGWIESSCKYIVWGIKLLLLIQKTYLSYLWSKGFLCLASNDLNGGILEVKMEVKLNFIVSISCGVSNSCFW